MATSIKSEAETKYTETSTNIMNFEVVFHPFDPDDQDEICSRWHLWSEKLKRYIRHKKIASDEDKIDTFLLFAGDGINKIYIDEKYGTIDKFDDLIAKFSEKFNTTTNKVFNNFPLYFPVTNFLLFN